MKSSAKKTKAFSTLIGKYVHEPAQWFAKNYAKNIIERQRLSVLLLTTVGVLLIVPLNILGIPGESDPVFVKLDIAWLITIPVTMTAMLKRKISLSANLKSQLLIALTIFSAAMIYSAFHTNEDYYQVMIFRYNTLSVSMLMLSLISHFKHTTYLMSFVTLVTYLACSFISKDVYIKNQLPLFFIVFILISILGAKLLDDIKGLQTENEELRKGEESLTKLLGLGKQQASALLKLGQTKNPGEKQTIRMLGMMDDQSKERLFTAVNEYITQKNTQLSAINKAFPELSASEAEICRLILQGKKLSEICGMLNKSQGNITSQRTHIRAKLNLKPKENLNEALAKRLDLYRSAGKAKL